ncbi:amino acid ABC transporter permease, partial [Salmonella enterica subsp. enterica serovar Enteritidis]|nr:amino acid ABC transporter permease [Salmonella enterica subsp. enterica serovar Enteritidis]
FAIGLVDFFRASYVRGDLMGLLTPYILLAGAFYFVVSLTASTAVNHLRKRFRMA